MGGLRLTRRAEHMTDATRTEVVFVRAEICLNRNERHLKATDSRPPHRALAREARKHRRVVTGKARVVAARRHRGFPALAVDYADRDLSLPVNRMSYARLEAVVSQMPKRHRGDISNSQNQCVTIRHLLEG